MAVSKSGGIQLDAEINATLEKGKSLGDYRGHYYLDISNNTAKLVPGGSPISFSQLDNTAKLPEAVPNTPDIELIKQSPATVDKFQGTGTGVLLFVDWKTTGIPDQPVLTYTPVWNTPAPTTEWYETTGGAFTPISASSKLRNIRGNDAHYRVSSSISISASSVGTRTFLARGITYTSGPLGVEATRTQELGHQYTVSVVGAGEPTITVQTQNGGAQTSSGTIITYTDGATAISYPRLGVAFNYTFAVNESPGWIESARSENHQSYVSVDGGAWVASTAGGAGPYGPFHQSHDPTRPAGLFGYWVGTFTFTTPGEYRFKLVSSISVTFTKPDGTSGYVITATDESIHTTTIGSKTVDNAVPTLLAWSIAEDSVTEDGGVATATLSTQHAIGEEISLTASENFGDNMKIWTKQKITANSMTFKFTSKARNRSQQRILTLRAEPVGTWNDNTRVSDTVILTNAGAPATLAGTGIDTTSVDEGGSFTYTLQGKNFTQENYTWTTTFPAAAVSATSGSFTTPYAGNYYTGNYQGSFTVDTVDRPSHYADVTGQIKIYRDGILYHQTQANLKIKNTHAEPVTLPTVVVAAMSNRVTHTHTTSEAWRGKISTSITLGQDGTAVKSGSLFSKPFPVHYANPQPFAGGWIARIKKSGAVSREVSQEDMVFGIAPSGSVTITPSFGGGQATLTLSSQGFRSSIASGSCTFTWEFYNKSSKVTRPGGTITLYVSLIALPTNRIIIGIGGEDGNGGVNDVYEIPTHDKKGTFLSEFCKGTTLMANYADGKGGSYTGVQAYNSVTCGYVTPPKAPIHVPPKVINVMPATINVLGTVIDTSKFVYETLPYIPPVTPDPIRPDIPILTAKDLSDISKALENLYIDFGSIGM